jgi:hypothetical protein
MSVRDWKAYDAALVRRGEIILDLRIMKGWRRELAEMNRVAATSILKASSCF